MRRDPIIGLAVPCRKLHHRQVGREKFQRARQLLHPRAVAADHGKADRRRLRPRRDRAREIRDDKSFGALRDIGKGQRAAGRQQIAPAIVQAPSCVVIHRAKRFDAVEQRAWRIPAPARIRRSTRHRDRGPAPRSAVPVRPVHVGQRRRFRRRRTGRGSGPFRACRDASSETTAACGGHRGRRSIVSIPSFPIPIQRQKPGRAGPG